MSILTWGLKAGDFIEIFSLCNQRYTTVQIDREPIEFIYNILYLTFDNGLSAYFNKKKQRWESFWEASLDTIGEK